LINTACTRLECSADASGTDLTRGPWRLLLETFRPAFARARMFRLFMLLATGLVAQTSRRTVVGTLAGAGMATVVSRFTRRAGSSPTTSGHPISSGCCWRG
jgi:hypothetical protein